MQLMQFRAKSVENDLKPTDFLKRNLYFETEGVQTNVSVRRCIIWGISVHSIHKREVLFSSYVYI